MRFDVIKLMKLLVSVTRLGLGLRLKLGLGFWLGLELGNHNPKLNLMIIVESTFLQ